MDNDLNAANNATTPNPQPGPVPISVPQPPPAPRPAPMAPPLLTTSFPAQPPRKKGRGWMFVAIALFCVLMASLFFNLISVGGGMNSLSLNRPTFKAGPNLVEVLVKESDASDKIAIVKVEGIIASAGGSGFDMATVIEAQLKMAEEDRRVKAVVLSIDSPGGEVLAAEKIYTTIKEFQTRSKKPVVASMGSLAASGGYYVAAPCRWIVAHELTITGSIGVIMQGYNYRGLMNKVGLRPEVYKSGKFKDMLSGSKDLDNMTAEERDIWKQERDMVQVLIDEAFDTFKDRIKSGRGWAAKENRASNLSQEWSDYADGRILSGRQALKHGFVDQVGTFDDAVKYAGKLVGISEAKLVTYGIPFDFTSILRLLGKSEPPSIKVDLGIKAPELKTGRMYYLSPVLTY